MLDMGKPVVIADVARLMAARSERHISIEFTGLRPGEKLHEVLLAGDEDDVRPVHHLISHVPVPPLDPVEARSVDLAGGNRPVVRRLARLAGTGHVDAAGRRGRG